MKDKIKRYPAVWKIRHRSGNIRDHPQRYHVNIGKRYGNFRISNSYHNEIMKKEEHGDFRYNKKINGIDYVRRRIPYYVRKKDAEEEADAYRFFDIDAKVVPIKEKGKTFYSVYVPKKDVDWINKHMIEDYHVTEWESGHYRIKGWKKVKDNEYEKIWVCDKGKAMIDLVHNPNFRSWDIGIYRSDNGKFSFLDITEIEKFDNEKDALKFAVDWMKKHPNGV